MNHRQEESKLISLFATPVVLTNIGRDFTKLEADCFQNISMWKDKKREMQNHRSKDVYLFDNFAEDLKDIKTFCEYHLKQYMEEIEGIDTDIATLRITQSWLNKNKPNESHYQHVHRNSYLSGVFYFNCLPNDSIVFDNRLYGFFNNMVFSKKKTTEWNTNGAVVKVKEGDLILFPSWVPHYVTMNKTKDTERISLSFNTFPIGELGEYHGASHFARNTDHLIL